MNTKKKSLGKRIWENIVADYILIFAVIVLIIILSLMVEQFLTMTNIMNVLRQMSMVAIIAVGIFFVMVGGGIDISVGSIVGLITVVMATGISKMGINPVVVIFISLAVGALCGAFKRTADSKDRRAGVNRYSWHYGSHKRSAIRIYQRVYRWFGRGVDKVYR